MQKVVGHSDLARSEGGVIVVTNREKLLAAKKRAREKKKEKELIDDLLKRVERLEKLLNERT